MKKLYDWFFEGIESRPPRIIENSRWIIEEIKKVRTKPVNIVRLSVLLIFLVIITYSISRSFKHNDVDFNKTSNDSRTYSHRTENQLETKSIQDDDNKLSVDKSDESRSSFRIWVDEGTGIEFMQVPNKNFWIARDYVSIRQFQKFIRLSGYRSDVFFDQPGCESLANPTSQHYKDHIYKDNENLPAICISWYDAKAFADWMTKKNMEGYKFSLPTESEWQYACHLFENKDKFEEWCQNEYMEQTGERILGRVTRGYDAGWSSPIPYCEWRHGRNPNEGGPLISFRLVRSLSALLR